MVYGVLEQESVYQHGFKKALFQHPNPNPHSHSSLLDPEPVVHLFVDSWKNGPSKIVYPHQLLQFFSSSTVETSLMTSLYKDLWLSHLQKGGVLSEEKGGGFYVAFSRDQKQKVYVQHKMREKSGKIWDLLSKGGAVYVAGSSNKMPADVLAAFEEIVARESGVSKEAAGRWLRMLEKGGKYHVEAWA